MKRFAAVAASILASAFAILLSTQVANANSLSLALAEPDQSNAPGSTLSYYATVSAPVSNTGLEYLNGDAFLVSFPTTLDDSGYLNNFPLDLTPGQSYTGLLFTVTLPNGISMGVYPGSFSITGGSTALASGVIATAAFEASVTPEPSSLLLCGTGLACLAAALRGRSKILPVRSS